ncbi:pyridoxal kinase-like [Sycon ciliatum]|uniref:pyridoxal kinase-like n=1 Tax=Sycon ciliatum TaxID=27933 RepID=UPI0020AB945C|eukprot:scpid68101/ scgid24410/ Pyridoxal kinase; Pyridoxine kinase
MSTPRVLSIQSHVVRGYVGNKSATFPLQVLGFEVDAINSVQLCNHTGYAHFAGQVLQSSDFDTLVNGLATNGLTHEYTHILTGYVGSESFLQSVCRTVKELKESNPDLTFVCDPVMGDNGKFYVPETLLPIYRDQLIQYADVITPNQFEAELLTGVTITTKDDALRAISVLHSRGCKVVIITSSNLSGKDDSLLLLGSTKGGDKIEMTIPLLPATFVGTGDLFTALTMAWLHRGEALPSACQKTLSTMQTILSRTLAHAREQSHGSEPSAAQLELRLIQSKDVIESPPPGSCQPTVLS